MSTRPKHCLRKVMLSIGENVSLRSLALNDEQFFLKAVAASQTHFGAWVSPLNTAKAFSDFVEKSHQDNQCSMLVVLNETQEFVGVINFNEIVRGCFQNAFLGYYGFNKHKKKGLMTQALNLAIDYAFFQLNLHRLEANIQPENTASISLVERCGFVDEGLSGNYLKIEGCWQTHKRFALTYERAQAFWIEAAHKKEKPWLPDFSFKINALKDFLLSQRKDFQSIDSITLLGEGWDNDVFLINNVWVFRCPRRRVAATLIQRENDALTLLKGKFDIEIPFPTYQYIGPAHYPYPFHGYQLVEGDSVELLELSEAVRSENIECFALFLKKLHSITEKEALNANVGFQVFDRTNAQNISKQILVRVAAFQEKNVTAVNADLIHALCEEALKVVLDKTKHCLVHGDLYCKHVLFKENKLSAIIDWGDVGVNHPVIDLAALYSIFPVSCHEIFFSIYGAVDESVKRYSIFLALHSALACLDYAIENNQVKLITESKRTLTLMGFIKG